MDETSRPQGETSEEGVPEGEVTQEFRKLGDHLKEILRDAWESPERRKLQSEIEAGLHELEVSLNKAAKEIRESPSGQRFEAEVKDFSQRVRAGEVESELRKNLLSLLREVNSRFEKAAKPRETADPDTDQTEG